MRTVPVLLFAFTLAAPLVSAQPADDATAATVRRLFTEALARGQAHDHLRILLAEAPGRLAGSKALARAVAWGERTLGAAGADRVYTQEVMVPHWERDETLLRVTLAGVPALAQPEFATGLTATALGGSVGGRASAEVIEVKSLAELETLGRDRVAGRIVFFNRPFDPATFQPGSAYAAAVDQRSRGPALAARLGAIGALVRSMTHALDDVPHTGSTTFAAGQPRIPAAALSTLAADALSAALVRAPRLIARFEVKARWLPDAVSHNVIGEIRGSELPAEIILVGGHLDSWDISPGAHDDGAGVVQSIEVLRLFRTLGLKPRRTLRCVLFTNEENGLRGATAYAAAAKEKGEKHIFAVESDNGGFQPRGFNVGSTQGDAHVRAARWLPLFEPWGLHRIIRGTGGADVSPLMVQGCTVSGLIPESQRYFDYHHTTEDTLDKVNPRELHLGAAALAALIWLVDTHGL